jgi:hypothetical protein
MYFIDLYFTFNFWEFESKEDISEYRMVQCKVTKIFDFLQILSLLFISFVCTSCLFHDAVINWDSVLSNDQMIVNNKLERFRKSLTAAKFQVIFPLFTA